jgi:hypothetical protein
MMMLPAGGVWTASPLLSNQDPQTQVSAGDYSRLKSPRLCLSAVKVGAD